MIDFAAARRAMVDCQVRPADVTRYAVIEALLAVPRELFVPSAMRPLAYAEMQVPLAPGRVLLDARSFAKMLDVVELRAGELALCVGSGYGYPAAVAARIAGTVVALEENDGLAQHMTEAISTLGLDNVLLERGRLADGAARNGPYDVILLEGGVETVPQVLLDQLADGGRLAAIVMSGVIGQCRIWRRSGNSLSSRAVFDAAAPVLPGFDVAPMFVL
jgi:protein-L-isoaspartate(D-aspartate) O-methyltransferase